MTLRNLLPVASMVAITACSGEHSAVQPDEDNPGIVERAEIMTEQNAPKPDEDAAAGPDHAVVQVDGYVARCDKALLDLSQIVAPAIQQMLSQGNPQPTVELPNWKRPEIEPGIRYTQSPGLALQDCSGNFLRLASLVAQRCLNHEALLPAAAGIPPYTIATDGQPVSANLVRARDTRSTARWYHDQGLFRPVFCDGDYKNFSKDLEAAEDLIYPGAVVWFGFGERCTTADQGLEALFDNINHMGVVLDVVRDENGKVERFTMYHGRNVGKGSGLNTLVREYQGNSDKVPPFGNWTEPVAGIAPILPVVAGPDGPQP